MTPVSVPQNRLAHERRSAMFTVSLLLVCLLLGWLVKTAVQNNTRSVQYGGFTADVPAAWLVQEGAGDFIFIVRNPQSLDQLYRVTQLPANADLDVLAENRNLARTRQDSSFQILEATPVVFAGQDAYKVSFARVEATSSTIPSIIEGLDYYFSQNDQVMVLSLESRHETFTETLPNFQTFVQSVSYRAGE